MLAVDGRYAVKPDVAVVVFGEDPYAEFQGDRPTLAYKPGNGPGAAQAAQGRRHTGCCGFPERATALVNREINAADAFVAAAAGFGSAGLPMCCCAEAMAACSTISRASSVSAGRALPPSTPTTWPKDYDPLFAFGFGLTYADNGDPAARRRHRA